MRGLDTLKAANPKVAAKVQGQGGFLDADDLKALVEADKGRKVQVLVRCNAGRFVCPADNAEHFVNLIAKYGELLEEKHPGESLPPGIEWVRDVSLLAA